MLTRDGVKMLDFGLAKKVRKAPGSDDAKVTMEIEKDSPRVAPPAPVEPKEKAPARPAGAVIDLLARVDPARDAVSGS